jgi:hypothetical protein
MVWVVEHTTVRAPQASKKRAALRVPTTITA